MIRKLAFLFCLAIYAGMSQAETVKEITTEEELDQYITQSKFNGVVYAAKEANVLMKKAYGYKNLVSQVPLTTDDRFEIGSNTKQFTAASLLKLQEEGKLSLDDKVTKYLPNLTAYQNIKIRNLLTHTSGISDYINDHKDEFMKLVSRDNILTLDSLIAFTKKFPLEFKVGTQWDYSNSGFIIAGKILEIVSKQTWDQYIKENFLVPLNMNDTGYDLHIDNVSDVLAHVKKNGKLQPFTDYNLTWALSAGALYSTVDDLAKWMAIYDSSDLLSEKSKKEMQTPFLHEYGLGIYIEPYGKETKISHSGATFGFASKTRYIKESKIKVITLDNIDGSAGNVADTILDFFSKGRAQALKMEVYPLEANQLGEYVGTYGTGGFEVKVSVLNGRLVLRPSDSSKTLELAPNDKDSFNVEGIAGEEFIRNSEGKIIKIKHYQNGEISYFLKK